MKTFRPASAIAAKAICLALAVAGTAVATEPAASIDRLRGDLTACAEIQSAIAREGRVVLRYPSTRVPDYFVYDHYVSGTASCRYGEVAVRARVRAADTPSCPVYQCEEAEPLFDLWNRRR